MAKFLSQKFFEQTAQFCKGLSTCTHNTFSFERSPNRPSGNVESVLSWRYLSDVKIGHSNDTPKGENAYKVIWSVGGNWHFSVTKMKICGKHCLRKRVLVIDLYKIYCRNLLPTYSLSNTLYDCYSFRIYSFEFSPNLMPLHACAAITHFT